jgi:hypothetical protein
MTLGLFDLAFLGRLAAVSTYDADAQAYITLIEAADGQPLETGVRDAINAFVVGCKADGIWAAIKASCIMAGARTLAGALVPLAGAAPTNFNFVSGDYNRKTGLVGNASTKYLNSNRASNADPQDNFHACCYVSAVQSGASGLALMGAINTTPSINRTLQLVIDDGRDVAANRSAETQPSNRSINSFATGFLGTVRASLATFSFRFAGTALTRTENSLAPISSNIFVFAQNLNNSTLSVPTSARLAFYSIGESLDLALLDARVTTLINAFAAAIP